MWKALLRCLNRPRLLNPKPAEKRRLSPQARKACRQGRKNAVAGLKRKASQDPEPRERPSRPKPRKKEDPRNLKERKENAGPPKQRRKHKIHAGGGQSIRCRAVLWRRTIFAGHADRVFHSFPVD